MLAQHWERPEQVLGGVEWWEQGLRTGKFSCKGLTEMHSDEWTRFPQTDMKGDVPEGENCVGQRGRGWECQAHSGCTDQREPGH